MEKKKTFIENILLMGKPKSRKYERNLKSEDIKSFTIKTRRNEYEHEKLRKFNEINA